MLAYAEATDDVPGGPVFASFPCGAIAPASRAVALGDIRRYVVHYEQDMVLHRPLSAGHDAPLPCDARRAPRRARTGRRSSSRPRRATGRRARERAVRHGVLPRSRRPRRASVSGRPTTASRSTATRRLRSGIASPTTRRSATRRLWRRLRDPSRRRVRTAGRASRAGSSTGSARWRSRDGRSGGRGRRRPA